LIFNHGSQNFEPVKLTMQQKPNSSLRGFKYPESSAGSLILMCVQVPGTGAYYQRQRSTQHWLRLQALRDVLDLMVVTIQTNAPH